MVYTFLIGITEDLSIKDNISIFVLEITVVCEGIRKMVLIQVSPFPFENEVLRYTGGINLAQSQRIQVL